MTSQNDLTPDQHKILDEAAFHFFIWWTIDKKSSITNPIRVVVNPQPRDYTNSLAKGENMISRILDILVNFCKCI
jgi:hypothetical protein